MRFGLLLGLAIVQVLTLVASCVWPPILMATALIALLSGVIYLLPR